MGRNLGIRAFETESLVPGGSNRVQMLCGLITYAHHITRSRLSSWHPAYLRAGASLLRHTTTPCQCHAIHSTQLFLSRQAPAAHLHDGTCDQKKRGAPGTCPDGEIRGSWELAALCGSCTILLAAGSLHTPEEQEHETKTDTRMMTASTVLPPA